jgi:hypothetical protein
MKTKLSFLLFLSFFVTTAQTKFEHGFFTSNGKTTKCLIRDLDWKTNPIEFDYKLDENGQIKTRNRYNTKAFGIDGKYKLISALVEIDKSTDNVRRMGYNAQPEFTLKNFF